MNVKKVLSLAVAAALLSAAAGAHAEVRVSGFGQVVGGATLDDGDVYPERSYDTDVDFRGESLFAVQIDADLNERVTAVGQVLARGQDDFDAELAWAYAKVDLGHGFSAKFGRQRTPLYRYSDFLDVGYAYPWVRPPVAMYNQPWSNNDGVSLSHTANIGNWYSQVQAIYGEFEGDAQFDNTPRKAKLEKLTGVAWDMEYNEWLSLRAAYFQGDVTIAGSSLDQLVPALTGIGQAGLAERLDYSADKGTFLNTGFRIDKANWLVVGEYAKINIEDSVLDGADRRDWYLSAAYRLNTVTPYVVVGRRDASINNEIPNTLPAALPATHPLRLAVAAARASQQRDEVFQSVGVRWDFADKVALKADYSKFDSDVATTADADLVSAALVFTF